MSSEKPLRVAIIGGGIGGLFATLAIHHHCGSRVSISVYEQAAEYKEIGAGIGLGVNAAKLVHAVGLGQGLNSIAGDRWGVWIAFRRYDNAKEIVTIPEPATGDAAVRQAPSSRADLLDLLRHGIESRSAATLHTGKKFSHMTRDSSGLTVTFADSSTAEADLVVAADGIHSAVRALYTTDKPIYSGRVAYRAIIPIASIKEWWPLKTYSAMFCSPGRHFLVFPIARNELLNVVAFSDTPAAQAANIKESWVSTCDRAEVQAAYAGFCEPVQKLMDLMPARPSRWKINDREPLDSWVHEDGHVVLLGDAAHAMLPHLGAGAGQAIEDGWVLGRALRDYLDGRYGGLQQAAGMYETVRRPRAQKVQEGSRKAGMLYNFTSPVLEGAGFEDSLCKVRDIVSQQMRFVWEADLDAIYDEAREQTKTVQNGN